MSAAPTLTSPSVPLAYPARAVRVRPDRWPLVAMVLTIGYVIASKSFAYLGIPPLKIFIGEIVLATFALTHPRAIGDMWISLLTGASRLKEFAALLLAFMAYGVFELVRGTVYMGNPVLNAAHDFSFHYYALYFFIGLYVGIKRPKALRTLAIHLAWWNGIYGVLFVTVISRSAIGFIYNPGTLVPILFGQPYGSALAIFAVLCFERKWQRMIIPLALNFVLLAAMEIRSEWFGFVTGGLVFGVVTGQMRKMIVGVTAIVLLLAASYALDVSIPKPATRGGGTTSARDIIGRVLGTIDQSAAAEYSSNARMANATASWRTKWWKAIWESIREDPTLLLFGHGYGWPITDVVSNLRGSHYIRTPHSFIFFTLGYGGCVMLALFLAMQFALGRLLWFAFKLTGESFGLITWMVLLTWGAFDSSFESPYRAAPFFIIIGIAAAPLLGRGLASRALFDSSGIGVGRMRPVLRTGAAFAVCALLLGTRPASAETAFSPESPDIAATIAKSPPGASFVFRPGVYRNLQITPKDDQTFVAQPGAILNGSTVIKSFTRVTNRWAIRNRPPIRQFGGSCDPEFPRCAFAQDLFIDDRPLRHVDSRALVGPGTWYYDFAASTIYFADSPLNRKVELSVVRSAFAGPAVNVTIDGFVIEKYANHGQVGAIGDTNAGTGWIIRNNEVRLNHGVGITFASFAAVSGNSVHHNGNLGIATSDTTHTKVRRATLEKNDIAFNNWAGFDRGWAAGGIKVCSAVDLLVRSNTVHDNRGPGIWADIESANVTYDGNSVFDNRGPGIVHEVSYAAVIRNNKVSRNYISDDSWYWGAQILIQNSQDVEVHDNTVEVAAEAGDGIIIVQQNRGGHLARNNRIHGNTVIYRGNRGSSGLAGDFEMQNALLRQNNLFDRNHYRAQKLSGAHWVWGAPRNKSDFVQLGQEVNGKFTQGN